MFPAISLTPTFTVYSFPSVNPVISQVADVVFCFSTYVLSFASFSFMLNLYFTSAAIPLSLSIAVAVAVNFCVPSVKLTLTVGTISSFIVNSFGSVVEVPFVRRA